jgi:Zn-dependent metalloprotease
MSVALMAMVATVTVTSSTAAAAPVQPDTPVNPAVLASQKVAALVATRPSYLFSSAAETFIQGSVISSAGVQYVPYRRTYNALPVVGGDLVLVTNSAGQMIASSVAMTRPIGVVSTTPSLTSAAAEAVATRQLTTVNTVERTQLVVYALGAGSPRLAYESTVDGIGADGVSRLSVDVDALTGAVLRTQEHVAHPASKRQHALVGHGRRAW